MSSKRIAMVSLSTLAVGGIETHLLQIFRGLRGEFEFYAIGTLAEPFLSEAKALGVTCLPIAPSRNWNPFTLWRLRSLFRSHDISVAHTHDTRGGLLGRLAARWAGIQAVHTVHTPSFYLPTKPIAIRGYQWAERFLNRYASDRVIFVSDAIRQLYLQARLVNAEKARYIPNGLEPEWFAQPPLQQAARSGVTFLYVGRLSPEKGLDTLGEAFGLAVARRADMQLQIIGSGSESLRLESTAQAGGWYQHMHMAGHRSREEARSALRQADVFVLPSRFESMSYTLLEAMASGRAVIATDVGGNRDLVEPNVTGLLVPPKDPAALADAMVQLANQPDARVAFGRAGRKKAERYTLAAMTDAIRTLYRELGV